MIGEQLLGYEMTSEIPVRQGNAHSTHAPHNVYKAWGSDRWLALEIHSDEQFSILAEVIGQPELADDLRFTRAASRKKNEAALDGIVESWTSQRDRDWAVNRLNEAGLAAAPSRESRDLFADPHLRARGAFVKYDHSELGERESIRVPWIMSNHPTPATPAPLLGEHNESVLGDLLQLDGAAITSLREKGIIM